ncbi:MAG TPA: Flp pilus assembly protein CpaB, partial [Caulobacteraceae bacterium]|nr:Flp pilus assembly protein CpaB [Caulobacteraceae bacterium]
VAAVAAIGLALLVRNMMAGKPTNEATAAVPVVAEKPMARVLVAKRDLKVGERLTASDMDWQPWPVDAVNAAFVTDGSVTTAAQPAAEAPAPDKGEKDDKKAAKAEPAAEVAATVTRAVERLGGGGPKAAYVGAVVREAFLAGEPIVDGKVVRAGESGFMAVVLQPGMRAMSVPITVETASGGFILPGDRVDVLLSAQVQSDNQEGAPRKAFMANLVLQNVKVLAIDQATQPEKGATTVVGATATLEVGPREAEALALAKAQGDLSLVLRSYADVGGPSGVATSARNGASGGSVRIFRNGESTSVAVN